MRHRPFIEVAEFTPRSLCSIEAWAIAGGIMGAGLLGAVGSAIAGGEQASGEEQAANTQAATENKILGLENPYNQAGYSATTALNQLLGTSSGSFDGLPNGLLTQTFNPTQEQLQNYPGYEFQLQTGANSVQNAAAPGSGAQSGAALKQLMSFNQGTAASNYNNYFNQFQTQQNNIFSRLSGIAQLGQAAAAGTAANATTLGQGIANAQAGAASATAGGIVGATNSFAGSVPLSLLLANQANSAAAANGGYVDTAAGSSVPAGYFSTPGYTGD